MLRVTAGNANAGGTFAPLVVIARNVIGVKPFNQFRGKVIALHSKVRDLAIPTPIPTSTRPSHRLRQRRHLLHHIMRRLPNVRARQTGPRLQKPPRLAFSRKIRQPTWIADCALPQTYVELFPGVRTARGAFDDLLSDDTNPAESLWSRARTFPNKRTFRVPSRLPRRPGRKTPTSSYSRKRLILSFRPPVSFVCNLRCMCSCVVWPAATKPNTLLGMCARKYSAEVWNRPRQCLLACIHFTV